MTKFIKKGLEALHQLANGDKSYISGYTPDIYLTLGLLTDYQKELLIQLFGTYVEDFESCEIIRLSLINNETGYDVIPSCGYTFANGPHPQLDTHLLTTLQNIIDGGIHVDLFANNQIHCVKHYGTPKTILGVNKYQYEEYEGQGVRDMEGSLLYPIAHDAVEFITSIPDGVIDSISINGIDSTILPRTVSHNAQGKINNISDNTQYLELLRYHMGRILKPGGVVIMGYNDFADVLSVGFDVLCRSDKMISHYNIIQKSPNISHGTGK